MSDIAGQRALIVGGTSGVGLATAKLLVSRGVAVTVASRSAEKVTAAVGSLGTGASGSVLDARDNDAVVAFATSAGAFDHVVISGASTPTGTLAALSMTDAHAAMDSKFWGAYQVAKAVSITPGGSLTLVSGFLSQRPGKAAALQSAINAALEGLGRALAVELAPTRVNTVSPGTLATPLWNGLDDAARDQLFTGVAGRLPVGRVGTADDAAEAIVFVVGNGFTTGTTVFVDGGGIIA